MKTRPENDTELHDKINRETGRVKWSELERHFASGTVVWVAGALDLIDVALRIAHDDRANIERWMGDGQLARVSDAQAQNWLATDATLWASVVSPFVLVQEEKTPVH